MIKMKTYKKTKSKDSLQTSIKKLSIQFSLDGFSFCIENDSDQIYHFSSYTFDKKVHTPVALLEKIKEVFIEDTQLQQDFNSVLVIHQNNLATLVPNMVFDEKNLKKYLSLTIKTLVNDFITFDHIESIVAKNVYVPYININNYLFQNFGEFEYKHHSSILIEKLLNYSKKLETKTMYVHVSENNFDIVVCDGNQLLLSNSFTFETKEDFIYYILFTAEQLALNPNVFQLTFLGDIEKDSEIYTITYNYVRNISFIKNETSFLQNENTFSNHSNFILLG